MVSELSDMLSIISQENRLQIIWLLSVHKELCVCEIIEQLWLKQNLVSHHLMILKNIWIINSRKDWKKVYYTIDKTNYNKFTKHIKKIFNI